MESKWRHPGAARCESRPLRWAELSFSGPFIHRAVSGRVSSSVSRQTLFKIHVLSKEAPSFVTFAVAQAQFAQSFPFIAPHTQSGSQSIRDTIVFTSWNFFSQRRRKTVDVIRSIDPCPTTARALKKNNLEESKRILLAGKKFESKKEKQEKRKRRHPHWITLGLQQTIRHVLVIDSLNCQSLTRHRVATSRLVLRRLAEEPHRHRLVQSLLILPPDWHCPVVREEE